MTQSNDIKNPSYCCIHRVENGWVMGGGWQDIGRVEDRFVFTSAASLAKFIAENFALPKKDGAQ